MSLKEFLNLNGEYLLDTIGYYGWALNYNKTIELIRLLTLAEVPILGGDVYHRKEIIGAWSSDKYTEETATEYCQRSAKKSIEKIGIWHHSNTDYSFIIVPDLDLEEYDVIILSV